MRAGLAELLASDPAVTAVVGHAARTATAIDQARRLRDVVLMDVRMPGLDGIAGFLLKRARQIVVYLGDRSHPQAPGARPHWLESGRACRRDRSGPSPLGPPPPHGGVSSDCEGARGEADGLHS